MTIREIREMSGLTQAEFSRVYGIPVRTIQGWEEGSRSCATYIEALLERVVKEDMEKGKA